VCHRFVTLDSLATNELLQCWTGSALWYCPGRFDHPSLFAALLDARKGGAWEVQLPGATSTSGGYIGDSAILETVLTADAQTASPSRSPIGCPLAKVSARHLPALR
jgi:hypothetical protein